MRREDLLLREMRDAALRIRELVGDLDAAAIDAEPVRCSALLWHFTVLGEAASQIAPETRSAHPSVAWVAAVRMRNRIVHHYWHIDTETLVTTAADDLPRMIGGLQRVIDSLGEELGS